MANHVLLRDACGACPSNCWVEYGRVALALSATKVEGGENDAFSEVGDRYSGLNCCRVRAGGNRIDIDVCRIIPLPPAKNVSARKPSMDLLPPQRYQLKIRLWRSAEHSLANPVARRHIKPFVRAFSHHAPDDHLLAINVRQLISDWRGTDLNLLAGGKAAYNLLIINQLTYLRKYLKAFYARQRVSGK